MPLLTRDSTMQPALELELALAEIFNMAATPALSDPCVGACLVAEFTATGSERCRRSAPWSPLRLRADCARLSNVLCTHPLLAAR